MECAWKELLELIPPWLRREADPEKNALQEIRVRLGQPVVLMAQDNHRVIRRPARKEDLQYIINSATRYSPWTASTMAQGYLSTTGGHRVGICGEVSIREGIMTGISSVRSVNIRICRDFPGISRNLWLRPGSVLIIGPPGCGKSTLLRDLVRNRSRNQNVAVVDTRGELFPAQFEAGERTDILPGCGKEEGIDMVLRTMTPQCIAVDEITAASDCNAVIKAAWCGVSILATAHASSIMDLRSRPIYRELVRCRIFETVVTLRSDKSWSEERMMYD